MTLGLAHLAEKAAGPGRSSAGRAPFRHRPMSGRGGVAQHSSREAAYQFCIGALRDSGTVCDESFEKVSTKCIRAHQLRACGDSEPSLYVSYKLDLDSRLRLRLQALREHLWRLPSRYAAEVESAEDVATHLRLLEEVRRDSSRVAVAARAVSVGGDAAAARDAAAAGSPPAHNTPDSPGGVKLGSSTGKRPPTFGSSLNLLALEDQSPVASSGLRGEGGGNSALVCHELAVAAGNRPRLLSNLTAIFGEIGLNINEAHVFCTDDGFALDVFVVDGWHTEEPEGLQDTLTRLMQAPPTPGGAPAPVASPPAAQPPPEAKTGANDWEVDPNRLTFLDKVASGSFGDLFRGMYNGQEVAIKVLRLAQHNDQAHLIREFTQELSGELRCQLGVHCPELLPLGQATHVTSFTAVLRKVRHKNVVQLIGASTTPPKLCIVTEFMRRGSLLVSGTCVLGHMLSRETSTQLIRQAIGNLTSRSFSGLLASSTPA